MASRKERGAVRVCGRTRGHAGTRPQRGEGAEEVRGAFKTELEREEGEERGFGRTSAREEGGCTLSLSSREREKGHGDVKRPRERTF